MGGNKIVLMADYGVGDYANSTWLLAVSAAHCVCHGGWQLSMKFSTPSKVNEITLGRLLRLWHQPLRLSMNVARVRISQLMSLSAQRAHARRRAPYYSHSLHTECQCKLPIWGPIPAPRVLHFQTPRKQCNAAPRCRGTQWIKTKGPSNVAMVRQLARE